MCSVAVLLLISIYSYSQPTITSISALSGTVGSQITISGTGFNSNSVSNTVFFGAVKASSVTAITNQYSCDYLNGDRGDICHRWIRDWYTYLTAFIGAKPPIYLPFGRNITIADFDNDGIIV